MVHGVASFIDNPYSLYAQTFSLVLSPAAKIQFFGQI